MSFLKIASLLSILCALASSAIVHHGTSPAPRWTNLKTLPHPRQEHSTVAIDENTIAVVGGVTPLGNSTNFLGSKTVDWLYLYDIPSDTWSSATSAPFPVNHANVIVKDGLVYLLGGLIDNPESHLPPTLIDWIASGESHVYDPATNKWTQLESMPRGTERGSAIMGAHGDEIYVAGGMTMLNGSYQDSVTVVTAFNTVSGKWHRLMEEAANLPEGRQHAVGAVLGDTFFVTGGRWFTKTNVRGDVFMLNLNNQTAGWTISKNPMPTPRGGICGAAIGKKLYTFGGEGNRAALNGVFTQVEVLDLESLKWSKLPPMAIPRHGTSAAAAGNRIYIPGGGLQEDGHPVVIDGVTRFSNTTDLFDAWVA